MHETASLVTSALDNVGRAERREPFDRTPIHNLHDALVDRYAAYDQYGDLPTELLNALRAGAPHCATPAVKLEKLIGSLEQAAGTAGIVKEEDRTFVRVVLGAYISELTN